jgi:hypothetical protein
LEIVFAKVKYATHRRIYIRGNLHQIQVFFLCPAQGFFQRNHANLFAVNSYQAHSSGCDLIIDPFLWHDLIGAGLSSFNPDYKNLLFYRKRKQAAFNTACFSVKTYIYFIGHYVQRSSKAEASSFILSHCFNCAGFVNPFVCSGTGG